MYNGQNIQGVKTYWNCNGEYSVHWLHIEVTKGHKGTRGHTSVVTSYNTVAIQHVSQ